MADVSDLDTGARQSELDDLIAQATLKYSVKDYDAAAELYSQATELQANLRGEMAAGNADLLYAYGRCLFHAAVRSSDVLGSKVAGEKQQGGSHTTPKTKRKDDRVTPNVSTDVNTGVSEDAVAPNGESKESITSGGDNKTQDGKPYFQFTGDENFDTSEDEADAQQPGGEAEDEAEEEEDDFANAFEVLDLARLLLLKRLQEEDANEHGKSQMEKDPSDTVRQLQERLADTYDLQAEISLEGERFSNAVVDLRAALELKTKLFPEESSLLAEAHYKLSLALEFSSVTQEKTEGGTADTEKEAFVDEGMREEAAKEMEAAIASCKLRISKEEAVLRTQGSTDEVLNGGPAKEKIKKHDIDEVKEMVADMEQRLIELRQPPVSMNDPSKPDHDDGLTPLGGILGSILGESPAAQTLRLDEASKGAKDLSNLVKRKKPTAETTTPTLGEEDVLKANGSKRKVEFVEEVVEVGTGKKARLSDGNEEA
ncbi:MAG: hypothetical protein L6R36_005567 [Xanthoria steineri]|nr:MAG: hypothetical protein L6R36_005567 [Xanthoria steineri]